MLAKRQHKKIKYLQKRYLQIQTILNFHISASKKSNAGFSLAAHQYFQFQIYLRLQCKLDQIMRANIITPALIDALKVVIRRANVACVQQI
jgi:hypothetical protein